MKTIKLFTIWTVVFCSIQACGDKPKTPIANKKRRDCSFIYQGDTVNKSIMGIKYGHHIAFEYIDPDNKKASETAGRVVRVKREEGYYKNNKKEGLWKFYNKDGSFKDSVEYKNDVPVDGC